MKKMTSEFASTLVLEAIKSGSIKLIGPTRSGDTKDAKEFADIDAAYLLKIINSLISETPPGQS